MSLCSRIASSPPGYADCPVETGASSLSEHLRAVKAGETVSSVARRRGVAPNLLYRWRRLMSEGGAAAVGSDEPVVGSSEVRRLEERIRDLERLLGRKTLEIEILREALAKSESKKPSLRLLSQPKDGSR